METVEMICISTGGNRFLKVGESYNVVARDGKPRVFKDGMFNDDWYRVYTEERAEPVPYYSWRFKTKEDENSVSKKGV